MISPRLVAELEAVGVNAVHVQALQLSQAPDREVLAHAESSERIVVTRDHDFGALLAENQKSVSVILLRDAPGRPADVLAQLLMVLKDCDAALLAGSLVVVAGGRVRIRALPIRS